nr:RNA-directed DNA polymerase, eukaryota, reverse transcriptase zinc-binding domain protein [Tanacetum cinerariifolium]
MQSRIRHNPCASHGSESLVYIKSHFKLSHNCYSNVPFLFILDMEGLHVLSCKAESLVSIQKKLESLRRNFFIEGDTDTRKMSWVRWKKCLAFKDSGGLGIGSIYRLNVGLLFKWVWRFMGNSSDLWVKVIKCIYGEHGGITEGSHSRHQTTWGGIYPLLTCRFCEDVWIGSTALKCLFPRVYNLDLDQGCVVADRFSNHGWDPMFRRQPRGGVEASQFNDLQVMLQGTILSDNCDSWIWSLSASNGFLVAFVRKFIDSHILDTSSIATRWNRSIPIKTNVFLWRLSLNKLATIFNLDRRGIDLELILCPFCMEDVETVNHIFLSCELASVLWGKFATWWDLDIPVCANVEDWFGWIDFLHRLSKSKAIIEGAGGTLLWCIWKFRNELLFLRTPPKKSTLWDMILSILFLWISSRNPNCKFR